MHIIQGNPHAAGVINDFSCGIVASRFNEPVVLRLLDGALECLQSHGISEDNVDVVWAPGAFELPAAARIMIETGRYDALIVLGCVIRGETSHFDYVAGECASGIADLALDENVAFGFGVLTVDTIDQAMERSSPEHNKGDEAARAALEMSDLYLRLLGEDGDDGEARNNATISH